MHSRRRFARPLTLPLTLALVLAASGAAAAASWTVALDAGALRAALHDLRAGRASLDVGVGTTGAAAMIRYAAAGGPLGTLVVEGRGGIEGGRGGVDATVRGSIGPLGVRFDAAVGTRTPGAWRVLERGMPLRAPEPATQGAGWRVDASADLTVRWARTLTVTLSPRVHRGESSAWGVAGAIRRAGVAEGWDVSGRVDAAWADGASHVAIGATLHHVPRRAPETRLGLWWAGPAGWGIDGAWTLREANGALEVLFGVGPRWSDRPTAHVGIAIGETHPWGVVRLRIEAQTGAGTTVGLALQAPPTR